ncbi:MAG: CoA transferase [SAR202 cluster bacterium]|nr:CoA transferase [SAR202 cluster bacterium]|tara:strand:- start:677 stop:3148 length:2472 start_codon:yes stop_codon:yes gene_type:complete
MKQLTENHEQVLSGIRIVEIGTDVAAAFAARLCALYGADVITVEPPGGHPIRRLPPWPDETEDPEQSILFAYLGMGKRSVCLDVNDPEDVRRLIELITTADGVFESYVPGQLRELGIDLDELMDAKPRLSVTHVSPYGQHGPRANWSAGALTAAAAGGQLYLTGDREKPPLLTAGHQAYCQAGLHAFGAMLTSIYAAKTTGVGDSPDISVQEVQAATLEGAGPASLWHRGDQVRSGNNPRALWGIYECADGWIGVASMPRQTGSVLDVIGLSDMKGDSMFTQGGWSPEANELLSDMIPGFTMAHTAAEIFEMADEHRAPFALIPTPAELLEWPHHKETDFWREVNHPVLGPHPVPSGPIAFDGDRGRFAPAPTVGQHTQEVLAEAPGADRVNSRHGESPKPGSLPLSGLRVIDMTQVWSGPYGARFLADMGADVVKVEGPTFPDPIRTAGGNRTTPEINLSAYFNEYNRGKRSLTLDIKQPEGLTALKKLVATADVFIENWSSGVADGNELGYEDLREINPRLIYVSMPGFGHDGSDASRVGFGPTIEQMGGLVALQGYEGGPPHKSGISYGDPIAGAACAGAAIAALLARERTGLGSYCMIPQRDGVTGLVGEYFIAEALGVPIPVRVGMANAKSAPHNVYPTLSDEEPRPILGLDRKPVSTADDRWIAIDCRSDDEWALLVGLIDDRRLAVEKFKTLEQRREHLECIDALIAEWTKDQDADALAARLQEAGVTAAPVLSPLHLTKDAHLRERRNYIPVEHGIAGTHLTTRPTWRLKRRPFLPERSGPVFGADSNAILASLGYTDDDISRMTERGITGDELL